MSSFPGTGVRALIAALVLSVLVLAEPPSVAIAGVGASERLDEWLAANDSFRAGFTQSVFDEDGLMIGASRGTVAFRRPFRFRWDYEAPGPQIIVADGEKLWWYDIDLQQVTVRPVEVALEGTPAALLAGPRRAGEHFRIATLASVEGVDWVQLIPRGADVSFRAIRVGMQGREIRAIEMDDGFGQTTRIEFFDIEYNPSLAGELFQFEPPPGADIVRGE